MEWKGREEKERGRGEEVMLCVCGSHSFTAGVGL